MLLKIKLFISLCLSFLFICSISAYANVESCPNPEKVMTARAQDKLKGWFVVPSHVATPPVRLSSVELVSYHQLTDRENQKVIFGAGLGGSYSATSSFVICNYEGREPFAVIKDAATFKVSPKYFSVKPVDHSGWSKVQPAMHTQGQLSCQPSHTNKCEFEFSPVDCGGELKVIESHLEDANQLFDMEYQKYLRTHPAPKAGDIISGPDARELNRAGLKQAMLQAEYQQKQAGCQQP